MPLPIETERLIIRSPTMDDVEAFHRIMTDARVTQFLPIDPNASLEESRERTQRRIQLEEAQGHTMWTVVEKATGQIVGACGLFLVEGIGPEVELAYHFSADHWGQGYATEAAEACLRHGFQELGLERIVGMTFPENLASRRVLEKIGMTYEGKAHHYDHELAFYSIEDPDAQGAA